MIPDKPLALELFTWTTSVAVPYKFFHDDGPTLPVAALFLSIAALSWAISDRVDQLQTTTR